MQQITVRPKNQITLPKAIVQKAGIRPDDRLVVNYSNGTITLTALQKPSGNIMSLFGCAKGTYGDTAEEIDNYIVHERSSWSE